MSKSKKDAQALLESLIAMGSGGLAESVPEDQFLKQFYPLSQHARALDPHVLLVIGERGAGKTSLFRSIRSSAGLQSVIELTGGRLIPDPKQTIWTVGFDSEGKEHLPELVLREFACGKETIDLQHLWLGLLVKRLVDEDVLAPEQLPHGFTPVLQAGHDPGKLAASAKDHLGKLFDVLDGLDATLLKKDRWVFVTYDALDRVSASDFESMKVIIRGLIQFWASNSRRWSRLRPKIFLRRDLFERVALFGSDVSKIAAQRVELTWSARDLYLMILKRMMNQDTKLQKYLEQLPFSGSTINHLGWCPTDVSEKQLPKFTELLCGEFMGASATKGATFKWIPNHLQDGNGHILPRSFVRLFEFAARKEQDSQKKAEWPHLLHHTSLRAAIDAVSEARVGEITEEFPWLSTIQERIKAEHALVPFERSKLERLLELDWTGKSEVPPEKSGRDLLKLLMELGIFYPRVQDRKEQRVDVRDLYLKGFGLRRKGGVAQ